MAWKLARASKAEPPVWTTANLVGVVVVLAVVLQKQTGQISSALRSVNVMIPQQGHRYGPSAAGPSAWRTLSPAHFP